MLRQGQGEVKARSRQRKHNLNRNYDLMGFDTIEINSQIFSASCNCPELQAEKKLCQLSQTRQTPEV